MHMHDKHKRPRTRRVDLEADDLETALPEFGGPTFGQAHVFEAPSLDLCADQRKRPPPASGRPDGAPPLFDQITVRAAQDDLRNALTTDARLRKPAKALDHVSAYLNRYGIPVDRKKQERTMRRHIVNPVLAGR